MVAGLNETGVGIVAGAVAGVGLAVGASEVDVHLRTIQNLAHARSAHGYAVVDL